MEIYTQILDAGYFLITATLPQDSAPFKIPLQIPGEIMNYLKIQGKFYEAIFLWHGWHSGLEPNSRCLLRLYSNNGQIIAIAQQLKMAGTSITNDAENLANLVFRMCQRDYGLDSFKNFKWIGFYPKELYFVWEDHYSFVSFDWDGEKFINSDFFYRTYEEVRRLIGKNPPKSLLRDNQFLFTEVEQDDLYATLSRSLEEKLIPAIGGGYRRANSSEFRLIREDEDGCFVFGHPKAKSVLLMKSSGELCYPNDKQKF